jgi:hypothetical protein
MTKLNLAVLEQRLMTLKSTAKPDEDTLKEIETLEKQYRDIESHVKMEKEGGLASLNSANSQYKHRLSELKVPESESKDVNDDEYGNRSKKYKIDKNGKKRFINKKKKVKVQTVNTPIKQTKMSFTYQAMRNRRKHASRQRTKQLKSQIQTLDEKFARNPSQELANKIEYFNSLSTERQNRSILDSYSEYKSRDQNALNYLQKKKLSKLEDQIKQRNISLDNLVNDEKNQSTLTVPNKYKVKKLKKKLGFLKREKELLKERYFKLPSTEVKTLIEENESKTQAYLNTLNTVLQQRATYFKHSFKPSTILDDMKPLQKLNKVNFNQDVNIHKLSDEDTNLPDVVEVNHYGKNRLVNLKRSLRKLKTKFNYLEAKQLRNYTGLREKQLIELENLIKETEVSLDKTRELRNDYFTKKYLQTKNTF